MANWSHSGFTDWLFHITAAAPFLGAWQAANHIMRGVWNRLCWAVGRGPSGLSRSLGKQAFALMKVALEMKFYEGFYNFHKWNSRGFLIYNSWMPAELSLKKSACYKFFPPSNLMLLDYTHSPPFKYLSVSIKYLLIILTYIYIFLFNDGNDFHGNQHTVFCKDSLIL